MSSSPGEPACARRAECRSHLPDGRCSDAPPVQRGAHEAPADFLDELASPPGKMAAFASTTGARAASRAAPRRETRSAAPEVPSIDVLPHSRPGSHPPSIRGWAAIHRMSPTCGILLPAPLRSPHDPTGVDGAAGCEDSVCLLWTGPKAGRTRRTDRSAPIDFCDQDDPRRDEIGRAHV